MRTWHDRSTLDLVYYWVWPLFFYPVIPQSAKRNIFCTNSLKGLVKCKIRLVCRIHNAFGLEVIRVLQKYWSLVSVTSMDAPSTFNHRVNVPIPFLSITLIRWVLGNQVSFPFGSFSFLWNLPVLILCKVFFFYVCKNRRVTIKGSCFVNKKNMDAWLAIFPLFTKYTHLYFTFMLSCE
jgi:hypothetical protein